MGLYVIFELILCCVQILKSGSVSLMYKMSLVDLRIKPRQTCQHLQIGNHTKPLIGIVAWWVFDLNSLNLQVYLNTPSIVCIRIYRQVIYNGWSYDIHVHWMILIKTICYQGRFELHWISANRRVVLFYLSQLSVWWNLL